MSNIDYQTEYEKLKLTITNIGKEAKRFKPDMLSKAILDIADQTKLEYGLLWDHEDSIVNDGYISTYLSKNPSFIAEVQAKPKGRFAGMKQAELYKYFNRDPEKKEFNMTTQVQISKERPEMAQILQARGMREDKQRIISKQHRGV